MTATIATDAPPTFSMRLLERDLVPDFLIRSRIRSLLARRLAEEDQGSPERQQQRLRALIAQLKTSAIAINTTDANSQHYEVPTEFYLKVLGPRLKYSSCYYDSPEDSLGKAE
jgi:cyclopropane-fatty-acyl-phospholipid synthase